MFIEVSMLDGSQRLVRSAKIVRLRPTFGDVEPEGATLIEVGTQRLFSSEPADAIAARLRGRLQLLQLTTPVGEPVWIDADKVIAIFDADPEQHHPDARSVVCLGDVEQQLAETRSEVVARFDDVA